MKRAPIVLVLFLGSAALAFGLFAAPSAKATHYFGATGQEGCGGRKVRVPGSGGV